MSNKLPIKDDIVARLGVVYVVALVIAVAIVCRILYLQIIENDKWHKENAFAEKDITIEAARGDIYADDGQLLATSVYYYDVYMDLKSEALADTTFDKHNSELAAALANFSFDQSKNKPKSKAEWIKDLRTARKNADSHHLLAKHVDQQQLKQIKHFPIFKYGRFKGGYYTRKVEERKKTNKWLGSRTIGRLKNEGETRTIVGLEGAFQKYLQGRNGVILAQKISANDWIPVEAYTVEPEDGRDVVTTININIQDIAGQALLKQLEANAADHGCVVVMEVETGNIKAIINLGKSEDGSYKEIYNYAIGESIEPGSTFKLPALIVGMEDGYLNLNDTVNTGSGELKLYNITLKDSKKGGHGVLTLQQAFETSSNIGVSALINKYYKKQPQKFVDRLYSMRLNKPLGLEIQGEVAPYIKYPESKKIWSGVTLTYMSIGYEVQMTPLQILSFYNAVANNGKMVKPKFVNSVNDHGREVITFPTVVLNSSICSMATIKKAKKMLEGVVERGTAVNLKNGSCKLAGKTGTAQIANKTEGYKGTAGHSGTSYVSSFVGYFPADNPKYSCIVVVNSPSNSLYYGNVVAGPVFKEIADKIYATSVDMQKAMAVNKNNHTVPVSKDSHKDDLDYVLKNLNIKTSFQGNLGTKWVKTSATTNGVNYMGQKIVKKQIPNVVGMGLKDAMYILENMGVDVEIAGRGVVKEQSILAGTSIKKGMKIKLGLG